MATCIQQEAGCALDCLKSAEVMEVESEKMEVANAISCSICEAAITPFMSPLPYIPCELAAIPIAGACAIATKSVALVAMCNSAFSAACPTLKELAKKGNWTISQACKITKMC